MRFLRVLLPALLALAASPAAAQAPSGANDLAIVGKWVGGFTAATAEPTAAANACLPLFQSALATMHDAASARAASKEIRPCGEKIKTAYRLAEEKLAALEPLPSDIERLASFDTRRFIDEQRKLMNAGVAYVGDVTALADAVASGNRPLADRLAVKVKQGAGVFVDASILQFKLYQSSSRLDLVRNGLELRIILAQAGKLLTTGDGLSQPSKFGDLAQRAEAAVSATNSGWETDKVKLLAAAGGQPDNRLNATFAAIETFADAAASYGTQLSRLLTRVGAKPALNQYDALALAGELSRLEGAMAKAGQQYALAIQRIG